jgi:hypothetical protein
VLAVAVLAGHRAAVEAAMHGRGAQLLLGAGVLLLEAFLLFGRSGSALLAGVAAVTGAVLLAFLAVNGLSGALSLVAALLFALAAASAAGGRSPRDG